MGNHWGSAPSEDLWLRVEHSSRGTMKHHNSLRIYSRMSSVRDTQDKCANNHNYWEADTWVTWHFCWRLMLLHIPINMDYEHFEVGHWDRSHRPRRESKPRGDFHNHGSLDSNCWIWETKFHLQRKTFDTTLFQHYMCKEEPSRTCNKMLQYILIFHIGVLQCQVPGSLSVTQTAP